MKSNLKLKKGQMLIIGILFLAILLIFSTTIFTKVRFFLNFGTNATLREQARHVAEAGIDFAAREITNSSGYTGTGNDPLDFPVVGDAGNFKVEVEQPSQNLKTVKVTGYSPKFPDNKAKTTIRINLQPSDTNTGDLLVQGVRDNAVVVSNGYVYSFGGRQGGCTLPPSPPSDVQFAKIEATGYLGAFGETLQLPETRSDAGGVAGANGYIYVIGGVAGCNPSDDRSTVYFTKPDPTDGSIDSWNTATNPIPTAGTVQYAFFTNGYIYVIQDGAIYYASQDPGTGEVGSWQTDSVSAPDDKPSYIFTNGYLYHISGDSTRSVWYSPVTGGSRIASFTQIPDLLPTETTESAIAMANGYIYLMGGRKHIVNQYGTEETLVAKSVYYAPIDGDNVGPFETSPKNLPQPRWSPIIFSAAAINNKLFVFGGLEKAGSGTTRGNVWAADIIGPNGEIGDWTDNGGLITYSGWALDKATYIYK